MVLLDHQPEVLGIPSEGNTSSHTYATISATSLQQPTWNLPGATARVPDI